MQIKMCFFVKNIVLLFLFVPNDPENGKITCHNHLHYVRISSYLTMFERLLRIPYVPVRCLFRSASVSSPFQYREWLTND